MTDVALKEYLERIIADADRRYEQRFDAAEVALGKAETQLRDYKVSSNEWRDALKDQSARLATRDELGKIDQAVQELQRAKANLDGRMYVVAGAAGVFSSILVWALARVFQ